MRNNSTDKEPEEDTKIMTALILIEGTDAQKNTNVAWYVYQGLKRYASANMYWNKDGIEEPSAAEKGQNGDQKKDFYTTMIVRKQTISISTHGNKWNWVKGAIDDKTNEGGIVWARDAVHADIHIQCADTSVGEINEKLEEFSDETMYEYVVEKNDDVEKLVHEIVEDVVNTCEDIKINN